MLASLALLALALPVVEETAPPDPQEVEEILDDLRRRSNRYETLEAHYRVEGMDESWDGPRSLALYYRAPSEFVLRASSREGVGTFLMRDGRVHVHSTVEGETSIEADMRELIRRMAEFREQLDEHFPDTESDVVPGDNEICIRFEVSRSEESERPQLSFSAGMGTGALFAWLWDVDEDRAASVDEDRLVFEQEDGIRVAISRATGLIEWIETDRGTMVLERAGIDEDLDDELFAVPEHANDAERTVDQSDLDRAMSYSFLQSERRSAWGRMRDAFGDRTDFNERAREAFAALYRPFVEACFEEPPAQVESYLDELSRWAETVREAAGGDADRLAEVDAAIAEARVGLRESLLPGVERLPLGPQPFRGMDEDVAQSLSALEKDAVRMLYEELVVDPALERFDELVGG